MRKSWKSFFQKALSEWEIRVSLGLRILRGMVLMIEASKGKNIESMRQSFHLSCGAEKSIRSATVASAGKMVIGEHTF